MNYIEVYSALSLMLTHAYEDVLAQTQVINGIPVDVGEDSVISIPEMGVMSLEDASHYLSNPVIF